MTEQAEPAGASPPADRPAASKRPKGAEKNWSHFDRELIGCARNKKPVRVFMALDMEGITDDEQTFLATPVVIDIYSVKFGIGRDPNTEAHSFWVNKTFIIGIEMLDE